VIERKEFRKLIKRLAPQMSKEETDEVFNSIDVDGGGDLDFEEFSGWWESPGGRAFRDGQRDWKEQGEKAEAEAEAQAKAAAAAAAEQAGEAGLLGASKFAGPGAVGEGGGAGAAPGSADFVANWVMSGGAVGAPGVPGTVGAPGDDNAPPEGVEVPHYRECVILPRSTPSPFCLAAVSNALGSKECLFSNCNQLAAFATGTGS
jgi:hypothetical protein